MTTWNRKQSYLIFTFLHDHINLLANHILLISEYISDYVLSISEYISSILDIFHYHLSCLSQCNSSYFSYFYTWQPVLSLPLHSAHHAKNVDFSAFISSPTSQCLPKTGKNETSHHSLICLFMFSLCLLLQYLLISFLFYSLYSIELSPFQFLKHSKLCLRCFAHIVLPAQNLFP